jgi:hypothetical protein
MRTNNSSNDLESRAILALRALLNQISVIRLKDIRRESIGSGGDCVLLADIDVLGHSHTLACEVKPSIQAESLRSWLETPLGRQRETRVLIAPCLSAEAQALCKRSHAGFLDLDGNARISLGEVFIGRRNTGCRTARRLVDRPARPIARKPLREGAFVMPMPPRAQSVGSYNPGDHKIMA